MKSTGKPFPIPFWFKRVIRYAISLLFKCSFATLDLMIKATIPKIPINKMQTYHIKCQRRNRWMVSSGNIYCDDAFGWALDYIQQTGVCASEKFMYKNRWYDFSLPEKKLWEASLFASMSFYYYIKHIYMHAYVIKLILVYGSILILNLLIFKSILIFRIRYFRSTFLFKTLRSLKKFSGANFVIIIFPKCKISKGLYIRDVAIFQLCNNCDMDSNDIKLILTGTAVTFLVYAIQSGVILDWGHCIFYK